MRTRFRSLLAAGAAAAAILGAPAVANAPPAAADDCIQTAPGVTVCTGSGHGQISVRPPVELFPGFQRGGYGGPYFVPYWS